MYDLPVVTVFRPVCDAKADYSGAFSTRTTRNTAKIYERDSEFWEYCLTGVPAFVYFALFRVFRVKKIDTNN